MTLYDLFITRVDLFLATEARIANSKLGRPANAIEYRSWKTARTDMWQAYITAVESGVEIDWASLPNDVRVEIRACNTTWVNSRA